MQFTHNWDAWLNYILKLICLHKLSVRVIRRGEILIFSARCLYSMCFPTLSHLTQDHFSSFSLDSFDRPNGIPFLKNRSFFLGGSCISYFRDINSPFEGLSSHYDRPILVRRYWLKWMGFLFQFLFSFLMERFLFSFP